MDKIYEYFEKTTFEYMKLRNKAYRKEFSQFFTPYKISKLMVKNLKVCDTRDELHILEPSAGTGILILATIEKILNSFKNIKKIYVTAIEIDVVLYKILIKNLKYLEEKIKDKIELIIEVKNENFILSYGKYWKDIVLSNKLKYDLIISNPPYKKIKKESEENLYFENIIIGQPNLYHLFISLSLKLLADKGVYIFISPQNYLGGKYTENLRTFIFENFSLNFLYLFDDRNKIFGSEVLQEICISCIVKDKLDKINIVHNAIEEEAFYVKLKDVLLKESKILLLPKDKKELYYKNKFMKNFLKLDIQNLEFKIGKVVQFRVKNDYKSTKYFKKGEVPLLIPRHIEKNKINYCEIPNKNISIILNNETKKIVIENKNYVILRKNIDFKSKKIIQATVYNRKLFNCKYIALDNNLAYISGKDSELTIEKAKKICKYLNSKLFEKYYKMINTNHTINSYEFNNMLFPNFNKKED